MPGTIGIKDTWKRPRSLDRENTSEPRPIKDGHKTGSLKIDKTMSLKEHVINMHWTCAPPRKLVIN